MPYVRLLMPTVGTGNRIISGPQAQAVMRQVQGQASISPGETLEKLAGKECTVVMQARGVDTIGTTDLELFKLILANQGFDSPGLPATNVFCFEQQWQFKVSRAKNPEAIEFVSTDYNIRRETIGRMNLQEMKTGQAVNWILGHFFGLKGIRFESFPSDPITRVGGLESSNMLIGAAVAAGSILSGADYDLGTIFCLAQEFENRAHGGLTGGQGFAAGILGGAQSVQWAVHLGSFNGVARQLFGPELYKDFEDHVAFLLPGKDGPRSSLDVNQKWTQDALTEEGRRQQAIFTQLSLDAAAGYSNPEGIDWISVATAAQTQTDIRVASCPQFFAGIEELAKKLIVRGEYNVVRAVTRPGAGGYGTPIIVYAATEELAQEARDMIGAKLEVTSDLASEIARTGVVPSGWIDYTLSDRPIRFIGFKEAGFKNPEELVQVEI